MFSSIQQKWCFHSNTYLWTWKHTSFVCQVILSFLKRQFRAICIKSWAESPSAISDASFIEIFAHKIFWSHAKEWLRWSPSNCVHFIGVHKFESKTISDHWFRFSPIIWTNTEESVHTWCDDSMVSVTRDSIGNESIHAKDRYLVHRLHFCRNVLTQTTISRRYRNRSIIQNCGVSHRLGHFWIQ